MTIRLLAIILLSALPVFAQQRPDSLRIGIHQLESEQHRWDDLKLVPGIGEFVHGKARAIAGDVKQAIVEFQKGARKNKAAGYFNVGLAYFQLHNYPVAIQYFKKAERVKPDLMCRSYRQAATRILKEQSKASK